MNIEVKNLTKKFKNFTAVNNINFTLEKNKTLGLLGPNGCGKTTSIGMILGLITPTSGEVLIDNHNIDNSDRNDLLSKMNFASPYIELPKKLTVIQNLEVLSDNAQETVNINNSFESAVLKEMDDYAAILK